MKICKIEGCEEKHQARGYCLSHYSMARYRGEFTDLRVRDGSQGCLVEDCENEHYALSLCQKHWNRHHKTGHLLTQAEFKALNPTYCEVDECGKEATHKGMCRSHYMKDWYRRNPEALERNREASRNYRRPEGIGPVKPLKEVVCYAQAHRRVKAAKGSASDYTCVDCTNQAAQWALIHGKGTLVENIRGFDTWYSLEVEAYQPMCLACHKRYDRVAREARKEGAVSQ